MYDGTHLCPDCSSPIEQVPQMNDYGDRDGWRTDYVLYCTMGHGPYALETLIREAEYEDAFDDWPDEAA